MSDDIKVRRLMASIYPTRVERVLGWVVTHAYALAPNETGPIDWIGDRADDLRCASQRRRALKGTHLRGSRG